MREVLGALGSIGLGAGLMYFLDPQLGRRRRALVRDQLAHMCSASRGAADVTLRDLSHRAEGVWAEARSAVVGEAPDDRVLAERVRARMGRHVSHPHAIRVAANNGRITLSGPILAAEVDDLLATTASVAGVAELENRLEVHDEPGTHPALQGGLPPAGEPNELRQENWSPAVRLVTGALGVGLMGNCLAKGDTVSVLLGTAGLGLFLRSLTNEPFSRLVGVSGGRRAVEIHKTLNVNGPVERVFPFFEHYDNWPRFMRHLDEVRDLGGGRSHWLARGPAGLTASWDAVITRYEPNRLIAWRSEPGSAIPNAGSLRFEAQNGRTRVTIRLSYNPLGGVIGHLAARLFGADPKSLMNEDLVRLKGLIEEGTSSAPGKGHVTRTDVGAVEMAPVM